MITVAICTRNRASALEETLHSLRTIPRHLNWELIVCGNACTGGTETVAKSFSGTLPLRFVDEPALGLSHARNRALTEAAGDVIAFIDDDVTLKDGWLPALIAGVNDNPRGAVFGGPITPVFPPDTPEGVLEILPTIRGGFAGLDHGTLPRQLEWPSFPYGANMAFRRAAVREHRFDPNLGYKGASLIPGEERDFIRRVLTDGWEMRWLPGMALEHRIPASRLNTAYLTRLTRDYTALAVLDEPVPGGATLAGVPRWLIRLYLERRAAAVFARMFGERVDRLRTAIEAARVLGRLKGIRMRRAAELAGRLDCQPDGPGAGTL